MLNLRCSGSASTSLSSELCSNFTRYGQRQVIQPRQHFGQDASFQLFMQEDDGTDIIDTTINSLPARLLRCFKTMMRRMHAHHREQDNGRFFVAYRIDLLIRRQASHFALSITMVPYLACLATPMYMVWLLAQRSPLLRCKPTVVMACSESHNWFHAGTYRLLRLPFRMTCCPSTGRTSPSAPLPNRATSQRLRILER